MSDILKEQSIFIRAEEIAAHLQYLAKIFKAQEELRFRLGLGIRAR